MVTKVETKKAAKKQAGAKARQSFSSKLKNIWHKNWQAILIAVVFVGILGFVGINQLIIYNQKQQFKAAEESLDSLYADIVSSVGQPTSSNKDKSCGYSSAKFSKGTLSCGIAYSTKYIGVNEIGLSKKLSESINKVLKNNSSLVFIDSYPGYETPADEFNTTDSFRFLGIPLECHASYTLNTRPEDKDGLLFTISCSEFARAEYYPAIK